MSTDPQGVDPDADGSAADCTQDRIERMRALAPKMQNGTYTVSHPTGGHFTIKLYTETARSSPLLGKRIFAMLVGPNNTHDFQGVAFWDDAKETAYVWRRFKKQPDSSFPVNAYHWSWDNWSVTEQRIALLCDLIIRAKRPGGAVAALQGYTVQLAGRCLVCNRKLTTPESIEYGIGPICAERR